MKLDKVYLDLPLWDSLMIIGRREKIITGLEGEDFNDFLYQESLGKRVSNKSSILRQVVLYEKIDSLDSSYNLSNFKNENFIDDEYSVLDRFDKIHPNNSIPKDSKEKWLLEYINDQTVELMNACKKQIIRYLIKGIDSKSGYYSKEELSKYFDQALVYYVDYKNWEENHIATEVEDDIDYLYRNIFIGIYKSIKNETLFSSGFRFDVKPQKTNPTKIVNELYYTVRTNLKDEIRYLPEPKSLKQAFEFRNKKEIIRFREIVSCWLEIIEEGNVKLEEKIRKDIKKANKELKKLERVREYQASPLNFWINSIGGHIPVFSNILTATNMFVGVYEKYSEQKNSWTLINDL